MLGSEQKQVSGDGSTNIQAKTLNVGLSYGDARQVALDVFEANFYRLAGIAEKVARDRAATLVDDYLGELRAKEVPPDEAENPDMQYVLFTAQKEFARTGSPELGKLLVELLTDRTRQRERNLLQIVLNESIAVASKLTIEQTNALSLIFLLRHTQTGLKSFDELASYVRTKISPFVDCLPSKRSSYQHLEFVGCGKIELAEIKIAEVFRRLYPGLLCKGFTQEELAAHMVGANVPSQLLMPCLHDPRKLQLSVLNEQVLIQQSEILGISADTLEKLKRWLPSHLIPPEEIPSALAGNNKSVSDVFSLWDQGDMKCFSLTSVGIAIGHANLRRRTGFDADLSIWI